MIIITFLLAGHKMHCIFRLFTILYIVHAIVGLKYNEGCISESQLDLDDKNYEVFGWPWSEVHIGAWVTNRFNEVVLDITIEYNNHSKAEVYEYIKIKRKQTELTIGRRGMDDTEQLFNHNTTMSHGWAGFMFRIDSQVMGIYKSEDQQELFQLTLRGDIQEIIIKGSNLTLNCQQGFPIWWVLNSDKVIPLDSSGYSYNFTMYSTRPFSPALKFDKKETKISFSMSNSTGEISTAHTDAELPAHTYHNIYIICERNDDCHCLKCEILNTNRKSIEFFTLPNNPDHIIIFNRKKDTEDFFVTLHPQKKLMHEGCHNLKSRSTSLNNACLTEDDIGDLCNGTKYLEKGILIDPQNATKGILAAYKKDTTGILCDPTNVIIIITVLAAVAFIAIVALVLVLTIPKSKCIKEKSMSLEMENIEIKENDRAVNGSEKEQDKTEGRSLMRQRSYSNQSYNSDTSKDGQSKSQLPEDQEDEKYVTPGKEEQKHKTKFKV